MSVNLSGYQPSEEVNGLRDLKDDLIAAFNRERATKGEVTTTLMVVGTLRLQSCKYDRDPEKEPTVEVRFSAIEVAKEGTDDYDVLDQTLRDLRGARRGELELDLEAAAGVDEPDAGEAPGRSTGAAFSDA